MNIDAHKFDQIARNVFAPVYPLLAEQAMAKSGINAGVCLDLGSGGGYLGLAVAEKSDLRVYLLDESPEMRMIAERNIAERSLGEKAVALCGDVHSIPLKNGSVNLVVSRGSIYFWDNLAVVLKEIRRVLAPGGFVRVGGGFGTVELRDTIISKMREKEPGWQPKCRSFDDSVYMAALADAGITNAEVVRDGSGTWVEFRQPLRKRCGSATSMATLREIK